MDDRLAELKALAAPFGFEPNQPSAVPRLTIRLSTRPTKLEPAMYDPMLYFVLQGAKRVMIGARTIDYAAGDYLATSLGLPVMGQVLRASPASPYLGLELRLDPLALADVLAGLPDLCGPDQAALDIASITDDLFCPLVRLLHLLRAPADVDALAPLIERELYYRVLRGPLGGLLGQYVRSHGRIAQVREATSWIRNHLAQPLVVASLADGVGMSLTSFHRHFKSVTGLTPVAYQKQIRLQDARRRLLAEPIDANRVAFAVGYESASQFNREYRRLFGAPPIRDVERLREPLVARRSPEAAMIDV